MLLRSYSKKYLVLCPFGLNRIKTLDATNLPSNQRDEGKGIFHPLTCLIHGSNYFINYIPPIHWWIKKCSWNGYLLSNSGLGEIATTSLIAPPWPNGAALLHEGRFNSVGTHVFVCHFRWRLPGSRPGKVLRSSRDLPSMVPIANPSMTWPIRTRYRRHVDRQKCSSPSRLALLFRALCLRHNGEW